MKSLLTSTLTVVGIAFIVPQSLLAHCQVPCDIYDDEARIHAMLEDTSSVLKSTNLINELSGKKDA